METVTNRARASHQALVPAASSPAVSTKGFDPSRVRVTATDFNGQSWDGSPFSHVPPWLEVALRAGAITVKADDRDYALWAVETPSGTKIAEPGDDIVCMDGHIDVQKDRWIDAIATEARRATDSEAGVVHEGAGRQASPQTAQGIAEPGG
jgi:hypothetical protein